ncbi:MAG TPA: heme exporter protein CcmB [Acidimicrobiia bacterium]|jgi:heme exporter protein B
MSVWGEARMVAAKDLRIELRSRVALAQILPFGLIVILLFAFALDPDRGLLPRVAPGLFWVAVLLAALLALGRSFSIEQQWNARDGLRIAGLDGGAIFLGKAAAIATELFVLEVVLGAGVVLLYDVSVHGLGILLLSAVAATIGLAATGTLYGVLAAGLRLRETLLPLLLLPVVAPVMLGATRAFEDGLQGSPGDAWPWIALLAIFAVLYTAIGVLAFGSLWEEA